MANTRKLDLSNIKQLIIVFALNLIQCVISTIMQIDSISGRSTGFFAQAFMGNEKL